MILKRYYGRILFSCLFITIIWNLFTFSFTDTTTKHHTSEVGPRSHVFNPDIKLESLFAPAENFISPSLFDKETNYIYCHESKCRFLFISHSIDQESEAQQYFQMFTRLAEKLDRIMVLPNVESMQIGACKKYPFDFYYSVEGLKKMYPNVNFISQEDFKRWTKERYLKPSVKQIVISGSRNKGKSSYCLDQFDLDHRALGSKPITITRHKNDTDLQDKVTKSLIDGNVSDAEVLLFDYNMQYTTFPRESHDSIKYSGDIITKATDMATTFAPYIAIYWQMERGKPDNMPKCAEKLALKIKTLKYQHNISKVYLATDYPLKNGVKSFKFHNLSSFHHMAIKILNKKIKFESWMSFTFKDRWGKAIKGKKLAETGLTGILDKLMCTRAKVFLTAPQECRKRISSYSDIIIQERKQNLKNKGKEKY